MDEDNRSQDAPEEAELGGQDSYELDDADGDSYAVDEEFEAVASGGAAAPFSPIDLSDAPQRIVDAIAGLRRHAQYSGTVVEACFPLRGWVLRRRVLRVHWPGLWAKLRHQMRQALAAFARKARTSAATALKAAAIFGLATLLGYLAVQTLSQGMLVLLAVLLAPGVVFMAAASFVMRLAEDPGGLIVKTLLVVAVLAAGGAWISLGDTAASRTLKDWVIGLVATLAVGGVLILAIWVLTRRDYMIVSPGMYFLYSGLHESVAASGHKRTSLIRLTPTRYTFLAVVAMVLTVLRSREGAWYLISFIRRRRGFGCYRLVEEVTHSQTHSQATFYDFVAPEQEMAEAGITWEPAPFTLDELLTPDASAET